MEPAEKKNVFFFIYLFFFFFKKWRVNDKLKNMMQRDGNKKDMMKRVAIRRASDLFMRPSVDRKIGHWIVFFFLQYFHSLSSRIPEFFGKHHKRPTFFINGTNEWWFNKSLESHKSAIHYEGVAKHFFCLLDRLLLKNENNHLIIVYWSIDSSTIYHI